MLALGALLLAGCSNKAQRLYQRAEMFLAQGQPYLAAADYYRLITEQPRSALADDALYKLAYLHREEFHSPRQAILTYQTLADQYPDSPYADDALLWVLQIEGRDLKDPAAVRRTCTLIKERFPTDERVLASAQLQLARTLFAGGQYDQADREAQALIHLYPKSERQCSAALLMRARVCEKLGKPGDEKAMKLYEQIVRRYPDTPGAVEAKRSIGWTYYGVRNTQMAEELRAKERAAKVMSDVPTPALVGSNHLKPFACLSALLAQRGIRATPEELLVVSGGAFAFAYDPNQPQATTSLLNRSALIAAAEQYGFATNVLSSLSVEGSFASLTQAIGEG
ncbi:MAG: tetratricopeptide repeat protein, partial [Armatimonadota bacterium]